MEKIEALIAMKVLKVRNVFKLFSKAFYFFVKASGDLL
jgi:hypothetical protein